MTAKHYCPCCSNSMLRHLSNRYSYWYCSSCRIEMPHLENQGNIQQKSSHLFFNNSIESLVSKSKEIQQTAS